MTPLRARWLLALPALWLLGAWLAPEDPGPLPAPPPATQAAP